MMQRNTLPTGRQEKVANRIKELSAEFLGREGNKSSLINVISVNCSPDLKRATICITVLPTDKEKTALEFAKRKRPELRQFLKKNPELVAAGTIVVCRAVEYHALCYWGIQDFSTRFKEIQAGTISSLS